MVSRNILCLFLTGIFLSITLFTPAILAAQGPSMTPALLNELVSGIVRRPEDTARRLLLGEEDTTFARKCATPIVRMALAHQDWLSEENRFILHRPDDHPLVRYYSLDGSVNLTYDTLHFRIHYTESGYNAVDGSDGLTATTPQFVKDLGDYFEQAWEYEVNTLKYDAPPPDGTNGGNEKFDVYIQNLNYYGYTLVESGHPIIVVDNDYENDGSYTLRFEPNLDPEDDKAGNMKITAAHEFFHAIQYYYDDWNDECIWWEENTAVWMEDEVFDYVDGYLNYLGAPFDDLNWNLRWDSGEPWYPLDGNQPETSKARPANVWFEAPHLSLDTQTTGAFDRYMYGGVIWAKYLAAMFGEEFIKDSFIITDEKTDAITALRQALEDHGSSLEETFADFRVKVLTLDPYIFDEAENYPLVRHVGNYGGTNEADYPVYLDLGDDVCHLSSRYIGLTAPYGEKKLVIDVDGQDDSLFGFALVLFTHDGYDVRYIPIDDPDLQVGRIEVVSFGTAGLYKRAALIAMNLSSSVNPDGRSVEIFASLERIVNYTLRLRGGLNIVSLPTNLAGAHDAHDFLRVYFDSSQGVQFLGFDPETGLWQISYMGDQPMGTPFLLNWQKGYVISVPHAMSLSLSGDPPVQTGIDLTPGHNIISSLTSDADTLSPKTVLESTDAEPGERISISIQKYDHEQGRRKSGYWFFGRFTGNDFTIEKGEGYMIDMLEARPGWNPP
ncbi:MAG: hypothetical protein ACMUIL_00755 [bacterium]